MLVENCVAAQQYVAGTSNRKLPRQGHQLALPYLIDYAAIRITASIGIAIYPVDGEEYGELVRRADAAMHRDKARGPAPSSVVDGGGGCRAIARTRASALV